MCLRIGNLDRTDHHNNDHFTLNYYLIPILNHIFFIRYRYKSTKIVNIPTLQSCPGDYVKNQRCVFVLLLLWWPLFIAKTSAADKYRTQCLYVTFVCLCCPSLNMYKCIGLHRSITFRLNIHIYISPCVYWMFV